MQYAAAQAHPSATAALSAAAKGMWTFGGVAFVQMLLYALSVLGLLAFDWQRMMYLYDVRRTYAEHLAARNMGGDVVVCLALGALVFIGVAMLVGRWMGERLRRPKRFKLGWGSLATLPASALAVVVMFIVARAMMTEPFRIYVWDFLEFIAMVTGIFYMPTIPSGLLATWLARWWIRRDLPHSDHSTQNLAA